MAECIALAVQNVAPTITSGGMPQSIELRIFNDAVTAMSELNEAMPDLILLDVLLSGPDGFTFLNDLVSYHDTARIPVILITSIDMSGHDLAHYGVIGVLNKNTMTPDDIKAAIAYAFGRIANGGTSGAASTVSGVPELPNSVISENNISGVNIATGEE